MRSWNAPSSAFTPWARLILSIRLLVTAMAVVLLVVHRLTPHDGRLIAAVCVYALVATAVALVPRDLTRHPVTWALDIATALTLVVLSGDWRSPFFLLSVTTLVTPSLCLSIRHAVALGLSFSATLAVIAHFIGPDPLRIGRQSTVETLATHLTLPVLVCFGAAAVADALRRLRRERIGAERLAIDAERRRIAWELHDSAKARVHAAHLILSAVRDAPPEAMQRAADQVLIELEGAAADMDTSLEELRSPLEGDLGVALRERIEALHVTDGPSIELRGSVGALGPLTAAHAYRIASEAIINAARHAHASRIDVALRHGEDGAYVTVTDDGVGMPSGTATTANGLRSMQSRARTIDADLHIGAAPSGGGTVVELHIPAAAARAFA